MKHTNYELNIHAESYPELRAAIRQIAEEHGILEQYALTAVVNDEQTPDPQVDERVEEAPTAEAQVEEAPAEEPVETTQAEAAPELIWYHKPETREVWQEEEAGRRKGIYKVDEATAAKLQAEYAKASGDETAEEEQAAEETAEEEQAAEETVEEEQAAEKTPPTLDQLRQAVMAYAKENGNAKGKALVEKYGASKISEVPQNQWPALMAEAEEGV